MLQPRKLSKYPPPPPSLVIRPSICNSPSHKVRTSLNVKPGDSPLTKPLNTCCTAIHEDPSLRTSSEDLSISVDLTSHKIQSQASSPDRRRHSNSDQPTIDPPSPFRSVAGNKVSHHTIRITTDYEAASEHRSPRSGFPERTHFDKTSVLHDSNSRCRVEGVANGNMHSTHHKIQSQSLSSHADSQNHYSRNGLAKDARQQFYDNYPVIMNGNTNVQPIKLKKKVSFALPRMKHDVSDLSISSNLSALSDCVIVDDDEEGEYL